MKIWMKWLVPVLVLGLVGFADAKGTGKKHAGLKGKIVSVAADGSSIVIQLGKKKGGAQETVQTNNATTMVSIDGVKGKSVKDLVPGEHVLITPASGTATQIKATTKHHHHKKK